MKFKADDKYIRLHCIAKNIIKVDMLFFCCKNRDLDSYRLTLEYEHIRKTRGF